MSADPIVFQDGFREDPDDPDTPYVVFSERLGDTRGLFYVHGALHLYLANGQLRKHCWSRTHTPLTELIKAGLAVGDYPLFVAEGAADRKLSQIQRSGYLWYCLDKLARIKTPLVVFGHSLGDSDQHIVDALARNVELPAMHIGVHGGPDSPSAANVEAAANNLMKIREATLEARGGKGKELSVSFFSSESAPVWEQGVA